MKNNLLKGFLPLMITGYVLINCGKEQPVVSQNNDVAILAEGQAYALDTLNSKIEWKGYKIFKSENTNHFGNIKFESGDVTVKNGILESGKFVANMTTLESLDLAKDTDRKGKLEGHLKSADFFEVEKFPTASYEITKVTASEGGDYNTILEGNLTIKGISKPVQFQANVTIANGEVTIATEPKDINREDFGVKFQSPIENGVIKNEITIQVLVKALEKK